LLINLAEIDSGDPVQVHEKRALNGRAITTGKYRQLMRNSTVGETRENPAGPLTEVQLKGER
jgi:hypothetical protein